MSDQIPQGEGENPQEQNAEGVAPENPATPDDRPPQNRIREAQRKQEQAEAQTAALQDEISRMSKTMSQMMSRMGGGQQQAEPQNSQLPQGFGQRSQAPQHDYHAAPSPQTWDNQRTQYSQPPQPPAQQQVPQGQVNMQEMLRQMVQQELAPLHQQRQQEAMNQQIQESKNRVLSTYGSVDTRPEFYDAVDREVSMRAANYQLAGSRPLPSIYEDAAAVVAQRWGLAPTRQQPNAGGGQLRGTATPDLTPNPEADADASEVSEVRLTEKQRAFNEQLRAMGVDIKDEDVQKHMASGSSGIDRLYSMAQAGKGRIGRSARSGGR